MDILKIDATKETPLLNFDPYSGVFVFEGKSYPENTYKFYEPVKKWLVNYLEKTENKKIEINFDIIYMNSSTLKVFFEIFDIFEEFSTLKTDIRINWFYEQENEISLETGEDFKEDFPSLKINLIPKDIKE